MFKSSISDYSVFGKWGRLEPMPCVVITYALGLNLFFKTCKHRKSRIFPTKDEEEKLL